MDHLAGGGITALGTLFLGIGWVGKAGLERWDGSMELVLFEDGSCGSARIRRQQIGIKMKVTTNTF